MAQPRPLDLSTRKRALVGAGVGLVVGLVLLALRSTTLVESLEARLTDVRTRAFAGHRGPDPSIVLATVEDDDVEDVRVKTGTPWPWLLDVNTSIFRVLGDAGAKAVAVDVLQLDMGAGSDDFATSRPLPAAVAQMIDGQAGDAAALGGVLQKSKRVALGFELHDAAKYDVPARARVVERALGADDAQVPDHGFARRGANLPVRRVAEGAARFGFVNVEPDADEVVRRTTVVGQWGSRPVVSLAVATASLATGEVPRVRAGELFLGKRRQRLDPDGSFLLDFRGQPRRTYPRIPASRLLEWGAALDATHSLPPAARAALEGKIVVWGVNLSGAKDVLATPLEGAYDGPEFQATAIDDLLHGDGRVHAPRAVNVAILLGLAALVGAAGMSSPRRWVPVAFAIVALAALSGVAWAAFASGTVLDAGTPAVAVVLATAGTLVLRLLTEGRYNKWLEGAFGLYLAPVVIDAIKKDPSALALGGARREITILFSDIAGFSKFSRILSPEQLVHLLNEYLTLHSDPVLAQGGVIDKFIGDAVMAFFGDPMPQPDHALRACTSALGVQAALPALQPLWSSLGLKQFEVRIGLNSGPAVTGNMGSKRRLSYTAMGDTVNLASRLEGANKYFGTKILVGPQTYEAAKESVLAKKIARVVVVGWDQPEPIYELVALREGSPPGLVAHVEAFSRSHAAAIAGDLDAAERALAEAERLRPGDGACAWFREKLSAMRAGAEPTPWSGVVVLEGK